MESRSPGSGDRADTPAPASATSPADLPTLSPSRAADFKTCPLLYRYRSIDRLPEQPSQDQARGTLVHAVLERLFDVPAAERTPAAAVAMLPEQWRRLLAEQPELASLFPDEAAGADEAATGGTSAGVDGAATATVTDPVQSGGAGDLAEFLRSAERLVEGYFTIEDPQRLEPAERESLIEAVLDDQLLIRGYVDRLDVAPDGAIRVVDYKTGGAPREAFEARALFQLKFYALVLWRTRGVVPRMLRLLYLKDTEICDYAPDADELVRFERTLLALWRAIETATEARDFRPKRSRLCDWCSHQDRCPEFGGTLLPFPQQRTDDTVDARTRRLAAAERTDQVIG